LSAASRDVIALFVTVGEDVWLIVIMTEEE
jgi:hypothetical protein